MQGNSIYDSLSFQLLFMNIVWGNPKEWTQISTEQLLENIFDQQKLDIINNLPVLIIRLMYENQNLHDIINSDDKDVSLLGIQMLFKDHLDLYNKLNETGDYEFLLHEFPKGCVYHKNDWYKKYCYGY